MRTEDVTDPLELALKASGCDQATVVHKPRLLSDNGSSYLSGDLAEWLDEQSMEHVRGAPSHPQTQGKIERWHLSVSNSSSGRRWKLLLRTTWCPCVDLSARSGSLIQRWSGRVGSDRIGAWLRAPSQSCPPSRPDGVVSL